MSSRYDTAVLGVNLGYLLAADQTTAMPASAGVRPTELARILRGYSPFVVDLFADHAERIETGTVTAADGTVDVYLGAVEHLIGTSRTLGVDTALNDAMSTLLRRASAAGLGGEGPASLAGTLHVAGRDSGVSRPTLVTARSRQFG